MDVLNFLFVLEREESYPTVPLRYLSEKIVSSNCKPNKKRKRNDFNIKNLVILVL